MRTQIFSKVMWGNKEKNIPGKKFEIYANDYDAELVFSTTVPDSNPTKWEVTATMKVEKEYFSVLARGLFSKIAGAINRGTYKANELTENKVLGDYDWNNKDLQILRVTSLYKVSGDTRPTRISRISVYQIDSWESLRDIRKNTNKGLLTFPSEKCVFSMDLSTFPIVHNSWQYEDAHFFEDCAAVFESMFLKPGSYNAHLQRVHDSRDSNQPQSTDNSQDGTTTTTTTSSTGLDSDDEFPF